MDAGSESVCDAVYHADDHTQHASYEMSSSMTVPSATADIFQQNDCLSIINIENAIAGIGEQLADLSDIEKERCSEYDGISTTLGANSTASSTTVTNMAIHTRSRPVVTQVSGLQSPHMPKLELSSSGVYPTFDVDSVEWPQQQERPLFARPALHPQKSSHRQSVGQDCRHSDGDFICDEPGCGKRKKRECDLRYASLNVLPVLSGSPVFQET